MSISSAIEKKLTKILFWSAIVTLIIGIVLIIAFVWNQNFKFFEGEHVVNHLVVGAFGEFVGGVIGTYFAIVGTVLMYFTLKSQRALTENSDEVQKKIAQEANESQERLANMAAQTQNKIASMATATEEKLAEMASNEARLQRFNSLFFELLSLFHSQRDELNNSLPVENSGLGANYFNVKMRELYDSFKPNPQSDYYDSVKVASNRYLNFYLCHASDLAPIFRTLYRLMDLIEQSKIDDDEKKQFAKIVRAQLGEGELFFLRYNAMTPYGKKFVNYINKYNLLKHLPILSLMEFKKFKEKMEKYKKDSSHAINMVVH